MAAMLASSGARAYRSVAVGVSTEDLDATQHKALPLSFPEYRAGIIFVIARCSCKNELQ